MRLAYSLWRMGKLVIATRSRLDQSEGLRMALLSGASFVLGLTFIALLIADEAHAAGL
jgi:hypothetical protein